MTLSAASLKDTQRISDSNGQLTLLVLSHPSWPEPGRLVADTRNWTIAGDLYAGVGFVSTLPKDAANTAPSVALSMINVGRELIGQLEALPAGATVTSTLSIVNRATPTVVDWQFISDLTGISANVRTIDATLSNNQTDSRSCCVLRHDPSNSPGLFTQ